MNRDTLRTVWRQSSLRTAIVDLKSRVNTGRSNTEAGGNANGHGMSIETNGNGNNQASPTAESISENDDDDSDPVSISTARSKSFIEPTPQPQYVSKSGYLQKEGELVRNWKLRYFVLSSQVLYYYEERGQSQPKGFIHLVGCGVKENKKKEHCFQIFTTTEGDATPPKLSNPSASSTPASVGRASISCRTYYIQASSEKDKLEWMAAIQNNISVDAKREACFRENEEKWRKKVTEMEEEMNDMQKEINLGKLQILHLNNVIADLQSAKVAANQTPPSTVVAQPSPSAASPSSQPTLQQPVNPISSPVAPAPVDPTLPTRSLLHQESIATAAIHAVQNETLQRKIAQLENDKAVMKKQLDEMRQKLLASKQRGLLMQAELDKRDRDAVTEDASAEQQEKSKEWKRRLAEIDPLSASPPASILDAPASPITLSPSPSGPSASSGPTSSSSSSDPESPSDSQVTSTASTAAIAASIKDLAEKESAIQSLREELDKMKQLVAKGKKEKKILKAEVIRLMKVVNDEQQHNQQAPASPAIDAVEP